MHSQLDAKACPLYARRMSTYLFATLKLSLLIVCALGAFIMWASGGRGDLRSVMESQASHLGLPSAQSTTKEGLLSVATWNIAYGRGHSGDTSGPWSRSHIVKHLDGIADTISKMELDIIALQEVDFDAARSHHIHQGRYLAEKLGWSHFACVETWVQNYIPFPYWPPQRHYGKIKSGQCVISRFPLSRNIRYRLPQPEENPKWYNLFYLHRAIQQVSVEVLGETFEIFNVHFEAFNKRNRKKHLEFLVHLLGEEKAMGRIVLGDFNALPPEAEKRHAFKDEPKDDYRKDDSMSLMLSRSDFSETFRKLQGKGLIESHTFPAHEPNRRLDYLFGSQRFEAIRAWIPEASELSDHLPVATRFQI